jgi:hypothetical protein
MAFSTSNCYSLRNNKKELSAQVKALTAGYIARGGKINVCRPGVAQGASFSRNKSPFNNLRVTESPLHR